MGTSQPLDELVPNAPASRGPPPDQDDLRELLRAERDPCDPLPEVPQHGSPPQGEGSPEGVVRPGGPQSGAVVDDNRLRSPGSGAATEVIARY